VELKGAWSLINRRSYGFLDLYCYANAQNNLAIMYNNGHGVPQDYAEGLRCLGSRLNKASRLLSICLHPPMSTVRACRRTMPRRRSGLAWLLTKVSQLLSITSGSHTAMVGRLPGLCAIIYVVRIVGGHSYKNAILGRDAAAKEMTDTQIEEAQKLARDWKPTTEAT
jgi:hypothetical protein